MAWGWITDVMHSNIIPGTRAVRRLFGDCFAGGTRLRLSRARLGALMLALICRMRGTRMWIGGCGLVGVCMSM